MVSPDEALKGGLASLHKSENFSDFTINCGPYSFNVHKAVLCMHTDYFLAACSNFKEAKENAIDLEVSATDPSCDDPEAVKCMVHYLYHLDYEAENSPSLTSTSDQITSPIASPPAQIGYIPPNLRKKSKKAPNQMTKADAGADMELHSKVFACAVKYRIQALRDLVASKFTNAVNCGYMHESFPNVISHVYTTTPEDVRELRDVVANMINSRIELLNNAKVASVVQSIDSLAWELQRKSKGLPAVIGGSEIVTALPEPANDWYYNSRSSQGWGTPFGNH